MIRGAEKYTEMPLDRRGVIEETYSSDAFERQPSGFSVQSGSTRIPGGILKNNRAAPGDYGQNSNQSSPHSTTMGLSPQNGYAQQPLMMTYATVPRAPPAVTNMLPMQPNGNMPMLPNGNISYTKAPSPSFHFDKSGPYQPTTNSEASFNTRKTDKLADVYSTSGDTVEFAGNLKAFFDNTIPAVVWLTLLLIQAVFGFTTILIGTFNYPYCNIQPMIPIYLITSGILLIINAIVRMASYMGQNQHPGNAKLKQELCYYGIEGIILLIIVVNVILGCVWVYGVRYHVHYDEGMFEDHYCDQTVYWTGWISVTGHLATFGIFIITIILILICGSLSGS
uniref:MARVEL domain-containing protein n=1 Tax=Panagrellus redivivus TaxID=6233 RepID=A0A7E4VMR6_PANRE